MQDISELYSLASSAFASRIHRFLYVATPKAACTTLKWWFAAQEGYSKSIGVHNPSDESAAELMIHDVLPRRFPECQIWPPEKLLEFAHTPGIFSFAVVRNPYSRIFSAWQSKLLLREPIQIEPYRDFSFADLPVRSKSDFVQSFEMFLEHLREREAPHFWDPHWSGQWRHLRPDILPYSIVGKLEDLGELRSRLAAHIGPGHSDPFCSGIRNDSLVPYSDKYLSGRAARLIREMYAEDFERFGYSTEVPTGKPPLKDDLFELAAKAIAMIRARHDRMAIQRSCQEKRFTSLKEAADSKDAELKDKDSELFRKDAELKDKDSELVRKDAELKGKDYELTSKDAELKGKDSELVRKDAELEDKEHALASLKEDFSTMQSELQANTKRLERQARELHLLERALALRQDELGCLHADLEQRDEQLKALDEELSQHRDALTRLNSDLTQRDDQLTALNEELSHRRTSQARLEADLTQRDDQLTALNEELSHRRTSQARLEADLTQCDNQLKALNEELSQHRTSQARLETDLAQRDHQLGTLQNALAALQESIERKSISLKAKRLAFSTAMNAVRLVDRIPGVTGERAYRFCRAVYRLLPLPSQVKRRLGERAMLVNPGFMEIAHGRDAHDLARGVPPPDSFQHGNALAERSEAAPETNAALNRVLVVEHRIPTPDRTSGSVRLDAILQAMCDQGWEVTFVSHSQPQDYHWVLKDVAEELPRYEKALKDRGIAFCYGVQEAMQLLKDEGKSFQCAFLSYPEIAHQYAPLARAFMPNALLVYDTVDLHGLRFRREAELKNMDTELLAKADYYDRIENASLEIADIVVAITEDEKANILSRAPEAKVEIIPNIHAIHPPANPLEGRSGLVFIGHYLHAPNADAVRYFVRDVLPLIRTQLGDVDFFMLGSSITDDVRSLAVPGVHAIGFVERPEEWFSRARVFVAPLRFGAGMKGKLGQSLACGLPIVTTSIGAEGMGLRHGEQALIADDAVGFADQVVRLYRDDALWQRLSAAGMEHVQANFSPLVANAAIRQLREVATAWGEA